MGEADWLIKDMSEEIKSWGHAGGLVGKMILKCGGEAGIKALRQAVGKYHGGEVIPEEPAKGESQSNGMVEEAGKTVREHTRVYKEQLEEKTGVQLKSDDVIVMWMIRWAAMALSRFQVDSDGERHMKEGNKGNARLKSCRLGRWSGTNKSGRERTVRISSKVRRRKVCGWDTPGPVTRF